MGVKCPKCQFDNPDDTIYCGRCATPLKPSKEIPLTETLEKPIEELTRGTTFARRYEIIEELGEGGMGKVYRVEDTKLKQEIALKLIKPEIALDKKIIERFRNELKTARKIRHKNVCGMYDLGEENGTHYITMEYVRGEDLKRLIRKIGQLGAGQAVPIAKQICEGLVEAHRLGVVHRDLKPQNVMVDENGNARIMDFGIARSLEAKGITGPGVMIGTPEYMSPEQVEGKEVDPRSDIYSLGVILYEMVTGRVPFEGDSPLSIAVKHKTESPPDPKVLNIQIPDDLSRLILKCLEKDKEIRYQSAGEVRSELDRIEKSISSTEREILKGKPLTSREITVTFGLKKLFIPALIIVALITIGVIVWRSWSKKEAVSSVTTDKPSLAILYFENNSGEEILDNWKSGLSEMMIIDLSQSKFLHVLSSDRIYSLLEKLDLIEKEKYSTGDLKKVATQVGVSHILRGSYITAGNKFIVNASLMKAETGEVISSIREEGMGEASITDSIDKITKRIKTDLNLSEEQISNDLDKVLAQITTKSPEAFKYYSEGVKIHNQGRFRASIPLYERAINIDPEFAMAFRALGISYGNLGLSPQRNEYMERATALKERLSDRERFMIEGTYCGYSENTYDKALEAYKKVLELYPDDTSANHNLAVILTKLEQWEKAIPYFEKVRKTRFEFWASYQRLAQCYRGIGENDKAKEVLFDYLENIGDSDGIHTALAIHYQHLGEYDLARSEVEKALSIDPNDFANIDAQATVFRYLEDLKKAEDNYWKLVGFTEPRAGYLATNGGSSLDLLWGKYKMAEDLLNRGITSTQQSKLKWIESEWRTKLAYVYSQIGNHEEAVKQGDDAWESAVQADRPDLQRSAMHMKGLVQLANHSIAEAQKTAEKLKKIIEAGMHEKSIRLHYHLRGEIELERGNFERSIDLLQQALSLTPFRRNELFIESLASVFYRSGNLKKAQEQYENLIALTPGGMSYSDIYTKSFYMLGKIYEQQDNGIKAIEHYEKFLTLWEDADPGLREVEDAKKRLAGLQ